MTRLLIALFVRDRTNTREAAVRRRYGTLAGVVGLVVNVLLFAGKFAVGTVTGSIAIGADAFNNLSDAGTSLVSLLSFKLSTKPPDRDHPFGHGRIEQVTSLLVSVLVIGVGGKLLFDSVAKMITPTQTTFSLWSLLVLSVSIAAKLWLALFYRTIGRTIDSAVLRATTLDSLTDMLATAGVLLSGVLLRLTGFDSDAYMGLLVAGLIVVAGVKLFRETQSHLLGTAPVKEVVRSIEAIVAQYPQVLGIHDLIIHNYGPGQVIASLHAEVDGAADVFDSHDTIDAIEKRLFRELAVRCTIHMDPVVTDNAWVDSLRDTVAELTAEVEEGLGIHDFRLVQGDVHPALIFEINAPFELPLTDDAIKEAVEHKIMELYPAYQTFISIDRI
ncbi:MAG: cation diffusion facilitator family transporter [Eubacteriales bacterium]